ncbi:MAG: ParB/RepB/Spo0J family partition protein [Clostridia bacterium]|nr:ParB/RepB/Spo0J family partition protein [Clostridia bacterium]
MRRSKAELLKVVYTEETLPLEQIVCRAESPYKDRELKKRAAKFILNGEPTLSVNRVDGEYVLLAGEKDYYALIVSGAKTAKVRVYVFGQTEAEMFAVAERIKEGELSAIDEAYLMKRLVSEFGLTQDTVAALTGYSRPAVANTLRLLTLSPEVIGLIESGELTAGHARTLVKVPKEKQYAFARSVIDGKYTVREAEKAVGSFLTEKKRTRNANKQRKEEIKVMLEKLRMLTRSRVTLIGSAEKGRICIDYSSEEDLYRIEELVSRIEEGI